MTREEAIEIFKNMLDAWDNYYTIAQSDKKREAVWLAISSLETDEAYQLKYERTTKNNLGVDCISRADAIKAMQNKAKKLKNEDTINGLCGAVAILYEMPSVTQAPRKGQWILKRTFPTKLYDEYLSEYKCSECYREIRCTESQLVNYPYCHCGARMIEPQEYREVKE